MKNNQNTEMKKPLYFFFVSVVQFIDFGFATHSQLTTVNRAA